MLKSEKTAALASSSPGFSITQRRWLRPAAAAAHAAVSRSFIYELIDAGKVKSHRIGGARLVDVSSLDSYIESQPAA